MGVYGSNQVGFLLFDGYNVLGQITTMEDGEEAVLELNHALGDAWQKSAFVGLKKFALSQKGFFDDAGGSVDAAFNGAGIGSIRVVCYTIEGNAIGKHFEGFEGAGESSFKRLPTLGALLKAEIGFASGGGQRDSGQILHEHSVETADGDTESTDVDSADETKAKRIYIQSVSTANPAVVTTKTPHGRASGLRELLVGSDATPTVNGQRIVTVITPTTFSVPVNTAAGTPGTAVGYVQALSTKHGGAAYLQVESITLAGHSGVTVKIMHSDDEAVWTVLTTFAAATARGAQRVAVADGTTVKRYLAAAWTFDGAGGAGSIKFVAGFARA